MVMQSVCRVAPEPAVQLTNASLVAKVRFGDTTVVLVHDEVEVETDMVDVVLHGTPCSQPALTSYLGWVWRPEAALGDAR